MDFAQDSTVDWKLAIGQIAASFFLKNDTHKENANYPALAPFPLILPNLRDIGRQTSIGLQDVVRVSKRLSITGGFSADHFEGIQGQAYNAALITIRRCRRHMPCRNRLAYSPRFRIAAASPC